MAAIAAKSDIGGLCEKFHKFILRDWRRSDIHLLPIPVGQLFVMSLLTPDLLPTMLPLAEVSQSAVSLFGNQGRLMAFVTNSLVCRAGRLGDHSVGLIQGYEGDDFGAAQMAKFLRTARRVSLHQD
jgi:hypothetical protein